MGDDIIYSVLGDLFIKWQSAENQKITAMTLLNNDTLIWRTPTKSNLYGSLSSSIVCDAWRPQGHWLR